MSRAAQPTYDFLTGGENSPPARQPLRETLKQSTAQISRADINNENLRAQLNALQYEVDSLKQERELTALQHQQEVREAQTRGEADFKRAQTADGDAQAAKKKAEQLQRDWQDVQDRAANEKLALEKKVRGLQDDNRALREEVEDARAELSELQRHSEYAASELEHKSATLQAGLEEIQQDLQGKVAALQSTQQRLSQREAEIGELENEVLRLKAQAGDSDTLAVVKKELTEQVAYIKKLEATNREHLAEVKQFRKTQKSIEVVEEEKRALEAKTRMMGDLRKELAEAQLQKRILEDEKKSWTTYLQAEGDGEQDLRYETPEEMARAFLQERLERLSLVDKLGSVQPQLIVKEENIRSLEDDKARLQAELEKLRTCGAGAGAANADIKAKARLERQKNLAVKEIEYLRAQLKTLEAEEAEFTPEHVNQEHLTRIHELEDMVEQYRSEVQSLHADFAKAEVAQPALSSPRKRSREEDEEMDARVGELRRKARVLQDEMEQLQKRNHFLEAEHKAHTAQISSLRESANTRVLELRDNPTANFEAIKLSTLTTLRGENKALLDQLEGRPSGTKVVPISTLANIRLQLDDANAQLKQRDIKSDRLKKIFSMKSAEFREAVESVLGWKLEFLPNGRVKAISMHYPKLITQDGEEEENSIIFDGENGTMKVSGGPQSLFASEIRHMIDFWVDGRGDIPCFLAACTLEFYEKTTTRQGSMV